MTVDPSYFRDRPALVDALEAARSVRMDANGYLNRILLREAIPTTGPNSPAVTALATLRPIITAWAGQYLDSLTASGSFAKGTANQSGTDVDLFISLKSNVSETLKEVYNKLKDHLAAQGYAPSPQNVSINIRVGTLSVDLVPAKRQDTYSGDHSLYRRRADTWTKTNVTLHINYVRNSNRQSEIRIIKLWRKQKGLDFPSFYLELTVINALYGAHSGNLSANILKALEYLRDSFTTARVADPANTNNIISDDLTLAEKTTISLAAARAINGAWGELVS